MSLSFAVADQASADSKPKSDESREIATDKEFSPAYLEKIDQARPQNGEPNDAELTSPIGVDHAQNRPAKAVAP